MTPLQHYDTLLTDGVILQNPIQRDAVQKLEHMYQCIIKRQGNTRRLLRHIIRRPIKGLYLWGPVGVGKTFLMDIFFDCTQAVALRLHFHEFMQFVKTELTKRQGQKNPLKKIVKQLATQYMVICLDEFLVTNIADAMILGELFTALFQQGLSLVTSANIAPDELYKDGIQRESFLPAIEILKQHTEIMQLTANTDYRRHHIKLAGIYYSPLNALAEHHLEHAFRHFTNNAPIRSSSITILGRDIAVIASSDDVIWFEFNALCDVPRSQRDYLELAKHYKTLLISKIPIIKSNQHTLITNFIHLIDIWYDNHLRIAMSAAAPPADLYPQGVLKQSYQRTCSRIAEMRSTDYVNSAC